MEELTYNIFIELEKEIKMIDRKFLRTAAFTVTDFNEETNTVTGINDLGSKVVMQRATLEHLYWEEVNEQIT